MTEKQAYVIEKTDGTKLDIMMTEAEFENLKKKIGERTLIGAGKIIVRGSDVKAILPKEG
jgi:hypothetical protein